MQSNQEKRIRGLLEIFGEGGKEEVTEMSTPTVVFWEGSPVGIQQAATILGMVRADLSATVIERLSELQESSDFRTLVAALGSESDAVPFAEVMPDEARTEAQTFHMAFFRDKVQVSFGGCGFVPLSRLLDYDPSELSFYMAEPKRIDLPGKSPAGAVRGTKSLH